ncbi:hypothetical protein D3C76_1393010 [compost metagenome]
MPPGSPAASAASAFTDMPLLACTAPPSRLNTCQRYNGPLKRLATRSGSRALMKPMAENPGNNRK